MRSTLRVLLLAVPLLHALPVSAAIITLEPDVFAPGTNVSFVSPGLTLWTATPNASDESPLTLSPVFTRRNPLCDSDPLLCDAVTGSQGFSPFSDGEGTLFGNWGGARDVARCFQDARAGTFGGGACRTAVPFRALLMEFSTPTSFVEISGAWNSDFTFLVALDEAFRQLPLELTSTLLPRPTGQLHNKSIASLASSTLSIKYAIAGSVGDAAALDVLRYQSSVPEPATLLITGVGLLVLASRRRKISPRPR